MDISDLQSRVLALEAEFPKGDTVYHKASARAFVVIGYGVEGSALKLSCDPGNGMGVLMNPLSMTNVKPEGGDDDE